MNVQTIQATDLNSAIPSIVAAIRAAAKQAGVESQIPSDISAQLSEAFKAASPYINGAVAVPVAFTQKSAAKAAPAPVSTPKHPAPVRTSNAVWNDRCGRWQDSVTGAFIPFKS